MRNIMKEISEAEAREITNQTDFEKQYSFMEREFGIPVKYFYNDECYWVELENLDGTRTLCMCKPKTEQSKLASKIFERIGFPLESFERRLCYIGEKTKCA